MNRLFVLLLGISAVVADELSNSMISAVVKLVPNDIKMRNVTGDLRLVQYENDPVKITGTIYGLTEGLHGFHVHEKGDISGGCMSAGAHYNPYMKVHGAPHSEMRHVGDLGNVEANADGTAIVNITDSVISLRGRRNNIIGRAIVVHAREDDLGLGGDRESSVTGNAGGRLACGVIGMEKYRFFQRWSN